MKIRNGFVSNSSTSSFIIRGIRLTEKEAIEKFKDRVGSCDEGELDVYEIVDFLQDQCHMEIHHDGENEDIYIGKINSIDSGEIFEISDDDNSKADAKILKEMEKFDLKEFKIKTYVLGEVPS